jgi:uncharacterized protein YdeI (YjbR/CyaY-like superfamily)
MVYQKRECLVAAALTLAHGNLGMMAEQTPVLIVPDAAAWSAWLVAHGGESAGVWLVLAKKGTTQPTTLSYDEALEGAICHGWVDGQLARGDDATFRRRFTPRRPGSAWSQRNVALATRLAEEGRMAEAGLAAVAQAKAGGAWDAAYAGPANIQVPQDLALALRANAAAQAAFDGLNRANRYAVLYRVTTARREETRRRRVEQFVAMLARGETVHPQ